MKEAGEKNGQWMLSGTSLEGEMSLHGETSTHGGS